MLNISHHINHRLNIHCRMLLINQHNIESELRNHFAHLWVGEHVEIAHDGRYTAFMGIEDGFAETVRLEQGGCAVVSHVAVFVSRGLSGAV